MSISCIRFQNCLFVPYQGIRNYQPLAVTSVLMLCLLAPPVAHAQTQHAPSPEKQPTASVGTVVTPPAGQETSALVRSGEAWKKGDIATAVKEVETALKENEKQPDALNWYGYLLLQQQRPADAIVALEKAIVQGGETPESEANLGIALLMKPGGTPEDLNRSASLLEKATAAKPDMQEGLTNLGHAYLRVGKPLDAASAYQKVLDKQPNNAVIHRMRGFALLKAGQTADAGVSLHRAADLNPQDGEAWGLIGTLAMQQGKTNDALNALEMSRKIGHTNPTTLSNLALLYSQAKRFEESATIYGEAADIADEMSPPNFLPRINQGISLARAEKWPEAAAAYEKVLAKDAQNYDALINLGSIRYQQGRFDEAVARFTIATAQKPDQALAWANLASAFDGIHSYKESADAWKKASNADPSNRSYADAYRIALSRAGKNDLVIEANRTEAGRTPTAEPLNEIGKAYVHKADQAPKAVDKQKNLTAALLAFQQAVKREPKSATAWNNLGVVYEQRGQVTNAIQAYKTAVRLDPNSTEALANLLRFVPASGKPAIQTPKPSPTRRVRSFPYRRSYRVKSRPVTPPVNKSQTTPATTAKPAVAKPTVRGTGTP